MATKRSSNYNLRSLKRQKSNDHDRHPITPSRSKTSSRARKTSVKSTTEQGVSRSLNFLPAPSAPTMPMTPTKSEPVVTTENTPFHLTSASLVSSAHSQLQHSKSRIQVEKTLSGDGERDGLAYNAKVQGQPTSRADMEKMLKREVYGAVYESPQLLKKMIATYPKSKLRDVKQALKSNTFFNYKSKKPFSVNLTQFGTQGHEKAMYPTVVKMLNLINKAAFTPNQFRPKLKEIVDSHLNRMWSDDMEDSETSPDLIQAMPVEERPKKKDLNFHWMEVEFFCDCKPQPNQLGEALMQLARYARAVFSHQLYRDHVYSLAICGRQATFVRFDRSKITHSESIDLETNCELFVETVIALFSMDANEFGYDTRFSWFPVLTSEDDRDVRRELRLHLDGADWKVLEVLCQRKCLIGRATTVMRLSKVGALKEHRAVKIIWRPVSRPHEANSLLDFKECKGVIQCIWSDQGRLTKFPGRPTLYNSSFQGSFFPGPSPEAYQQISQSSAQYGGATGHAMIMQANAEARKQEPYGLEERQKDMILMTEGTALWHIKRLVHLLIVIRDAIVGYAHLVQKQKIHRDISMGNILCDILENTIDQANGTDTANHNSDNSYPLDKPGNRDYDFMWTYEFPMEEKLSDVTSLEDYVEKRYNLKLQASIGKLSDFEFVVETDRDGKTVRGKHRTGTWSFISGQLLVAAERDRESVPHTYLHDLESFFWVLVWVVTAYTKNQEEKMNDAARSLAYRLSSTNGHELGMFKKLFIMMDYKELMKGLNNGWDRDVLPVVSGFAKILRDHIYTEQDDPQFQGPPAWETIKSIIDVFDHRIMELQARDRT